MQEGRRQLHEGRTEGVSGACLLTDCTIIGKFGTNNFALTVESYNILIYTCSIHEDRSYLLDQIYAAVLEVGEAGLSCLLQQVPNLVQSVIP